jgi:WD40 repeat protein/Tfp pilus assembly protein PilF
VFSPDGSRLGVLDNSGVVQVYDTATGRQLLALPGPSGVGPSTLAFSPDGRRLIAESGEYALHCWDVTTGRELLTLRQEVGELAGVQRMVFSPDGFRIATIHSDTVRVWDVTTGQDARTVPRNGGMVKRLAFSPDGQLLASACEQALNEIGLVKINVYDTLTGALVAVFTGHKKDALGTVFLPDGKRVVSGDGGGSVKVWEVRSGRVLLDLRGPSRGVKDVAVSPDGTRLAAAGIVKYQPPPGKTSFNRREARVESQVKIWDANTGEEVRALSLPGEVERVRITSDGKRLMASTWTGTVTTWDLASGKELRSLPLEEGVLAISPDGGRVATARFRLTGADRKTPPPTEVKVWDSKTGKLLRVMRGRFSDAVSLAWSPDGRRLAYSGGVRDRGIHIWDAATGHETFTLHGTRYSVSALAFSAGGSRLAAGGLDSVIRIWDAKPVTEADRAARRAALLAALPQWHLDTGEQALAAGQRFAALFHLNRAVQALPKHPQPLLARAGAHAEWGNWDEAERDFAQALRMGAPFSAWHQCALVRLKRQDTQGYRDLCTRLLARADRVTKPQDLNTIVWTCALGPDGVAEPARLVELQEKITRAAPRNYALANTLGAALYRAGRLQEAVKQFEVAVRLHGRGGFPGDWLFLAMAHHRLGNKEGKEWLERSVKWMDQFIPTVPRSGRRQPWGAVLELRLLRQEAEKVLKAPPGPGPGS